MPRVFFLNGLMISSSSLLLVVVLVVPSTATIESPPGPTTCGIMAVGVEGGVNVEHSGDSSSGVPGHWPGGMFSASRSEMDERMEHADTGR